jgi:hypothetical protein
MEIKLHHFLLHAIFPILAFLLAASVTSLPISIQHSVIFCGPANWQSVIFFYILNYGAHAMTIKSFPGDRTFKSIAWMMAALLAPFSGILRGCISIARGKIRGESDLEHAARAGALCAVVRTKSWQPREGDEILGCQTRGNIKATQQNGPQTGLLKVEKCHGGYMVNPESEHIHGQVIDLPRGYALQTLPSNVRVIPHHDGKIQLCKSHNILKWLVALSQLLYATFTLYRTRGDQIQKYGYAAFGLTVIPYAIMSLINLVANIVTPDYPSIYLVRSNVMAEAELRNARFIGTVGVLDELEGNALQFENIGQMERNSRVKVTFHDPGNLPRLPVDSEALVVVPRIGRYIVKSSTLPTISYLIVAYLVGFLAFVAPYAIIGGWTRFNPQESTLAQRGWLMAWLVSGQIFGLILGKALYNLEGNKALWMAVVLTWAFCGGVPAIFGFIVVGKMLAVFPSCVLGV